MASAPPLYRIEGLTKVYGEGDTAIAALRGVDLDVPASAMVVLLGPSGSGKSTFLNIVGGLDRATEGHVHFEELQLTTLDDDGLTEYRRRHVGFVFQFYNITDPAALWARRGHGYRVIVRIAEWQEPDVLRLPVSPLFRDKGVWAAFVVEGGGRGGFRSSSAS